MATKTRKGGQRPVKAKETADLRVLEERLAVLEHVVAGVRARVMGQEVSLASLEEVVAELARSELLRETQTLGAMHVFSHGGN